MVADIEEPGKLDASESHARRLNAKEKLHLKESEKLQIPNHRRHGKIVWKITQFENAVRTCRKWRSLRRISKELGRVSTSDAEACNDF